MKSLYPYQLEATQKINDFYYSSDKDATICMSSGLGMNTVIYQAIEDILKNNKKCKILYLCGIESMTYQTEEDLNNFSSYITVYNYLPDLKENGVFVTNYKNLLTYTGEFNYNYFDFIICRDLNFLNPDYQYPFLDSTFKGKRLIVLNTFKENKLVKNIKNIFEYKISDAIQNGYINNVSEHHFIENFIIPFLKHLKFKNILNEQFFKDYKADVTAEFNNQKYIFEFKTYRTKYIESSLIKSCCHLLKSHTNDNTLIHNILIINAKIDEELKQEILNETKIEIWDLSNLIYLCKQNEELIQKLVKYTPYPISDIKGIEPILFKPDFKNDYNIHEKDYYQEFKQRLENCPEGIKDNKKFEKICTDIINYLFGTEFFQTDTQHKTNDKLFRMDMICSLKGTTEFWKFLMQFYNTKFVVFEFKNYSEQIDQNIIFIASKYLFPEALRNVAFIISRHGLHKNAELIINSKIKNEKKLIISLTDEDLLIMLAYKSNGQDPSDYLLAKVEKMLMSLSIY